MARKKNDVESQLTELKSLADEGDPSRLRPLIEKRLRTGGNVAAAFAAELISRHDIEVPAESLVAAYERFLTEPSDSDKGCRAKQAIMESLRSLEYEDPDFYLTGMKYIQMEPVWGGSEDTAGALRGAAAFGLIGSRIASPAATMAALADLLHDSDRLARAAAARAIGLMSSPATVPLLRFKVHTGDPDPEVLGECFRGLLSNDLTSSLPFVAGFLSAGDDLTIEAATAMGESRNEAAVQVLLEATKQCHPELLEVFYVSAGLSRLPIAIDFLIFQVETNSTNACVAVRALAPVRFYSGISDRVVAAVASANDSRVAATYTKSFGDGRESR